MMGWSASTLQSSTRRGFVSARRWQSAHIVDFTLSSARRSALMYSGRHFESPTELSSSVKLLMPTRSRPLHLEDLGVNGRVVGAQDFGADLVELPVAPLLRALAAEHRAHVVELVGAAFVEQAVLDRSAHHGRRGFGAQGQRLMVAVLKGIHLLGHDVRVDADAAAKEFGPFDDGRSDLAVVVGVKDAPGLVLNLLPAPGLGRQQVASPFHGADWFSPLVTRHLSLVTGLNRSRR